EPGAIAAAVRRLQETRADVAYGKLQYWEGNQQTYLVTSDASQLLYGMSIGHPTVFVRRSSYQKLGLYRLDYPQAMDYEWLLRAYIAGAQFAYVDRCQANMQSGGVGDRHWLRSQREVARARSLHCPTAWPRLVYLRYFCWAALRGVTRRALCAIRL